MGLMILLENIDVKNKDVGGKAWGLGMLAGKGFVVPAGIVMEREPNDVDWAELLEWWQKRGSPAVALRKAIADCFASYFQENSTAYREFFGQQHKGRMNVVVQVIVQPAFAGVFFSTDPVRPDGGWLLEVIAGLGEDLVSGKVTPGRIRESGEESQLPPGFTKGHAVEVAKTDIAVRDALGLAVDMEWAIDSAGKLFVLQARPITTENRHGKKDYCAGEMERLRRDKTAETSWDG
jgi:phosphoenolpyruvate synthase/pyruvate phosphate dikinase